MADDQTGSIWTHFDGTILTGPLAGSGIELEIQPIVHTTWEDWQAQYPETLVPIWETGFEDRYPVNNSPGGGRLGPGFVATLLVEDDRLATGELVVGATLGADSSAYVFAQFDAPTAVNDELGQQPVVTFIDPDSTFGLTFCARIEGETLTFDATNAGWTSDDGTVWGNDGRALSGPLDGTQLSFVTSFVTEWYGWVAYHPDTTIYDYGTS